MYDIRFAIEEIESYFENITAGTASLVQSARRHTNQLSQFK
jgi:hypothetical protein